MEQTFSTDYVAQKIRSARIAQNMTQMQLADAMEVSYQAVSNWERANSMPDISKLKQLCTILNIGLEELLDQSMAEKVQKVIDKREGKTNDTIELEDLGRIIPLIPPREAEIYAQDHLHSQQAPDLELLIPLAPFLDRELLDQLADKASFNGDFSQLQRLAPFLSQDKLDMLADKASFNGDLSQLRGLAPFLSQDRLDTLADKASFDGDLSQLQGLAPFLSQEKLDRLAAEASFDGDLSQLQGLAPFLSQDTLKKIILRQFDQDQPESDVH
ncbi:MAG: helix-turn-helix domain-containing protein [Acetatifactor sp.]|nr:helix-turn-helix domain-containing protein [Acetatifactor sp.]